MLYFDDPQYWITTATSAADAKALIENQTFDLFILDYLLPEISGAELCRQIRRTDLRTPIIFYTALADEASQKTALAAGATRYLVKPHNLDEVCLVVRILLGENRARPEFRPIMKSEL